MKRFVIALPALALVLTLVAAAVLVIVLTYKKGERITRDPFEED